MQYTLPILIFIGCTGIALGLGWFLLVVDRARHQGLLNATGAEKQAWRDHRAAAVAEKEALLATPGLNSDKEETETQRLVG